MPQQIYFLFLLIWNFDANTSRDGSPRRNRWQAVDYAEFRVNYSRLMQKRAAIRAINASNKAAAGQGDKDNYLDEEDEEEEEEADNGSIIPIASSSADRTSTGNNGRVARATVMTTAMVAHQQNINTGATPIATTTTATVEGVLVVAAAPASAPVASRSYAPDSVCGSERYSPYEYGDGNDLNIKKNAQRNGNSNKGSDWRLGVDHKGNENRAPYVGQGQDRIGRVSVQFFFCLFIFFFFFFFVCCMITAFRVFVLTAVIASFAEVVACRHFNRCKYSSPLKYIRVAKAWHRCCCDRFYQSVSVRVHSYSKECFLACPIVRVRLFKPYSEVWHERTGRHCRRCRLRTLSR